MRAALIDGGFGIDNVKVISRPDPAPGPGQVLIRVHAASLNYRDLLTVRGHYNPKQPLPLIPCSDGAGEVLAAGEGVTRVKPGDKVAGAFAQGWIGGRPTREKVQATTLGGPRDGMLAELICLHESGVVVLPDHLSYNEGATLPCAAVTAWSALVRHGHLKAGETVLTLGTGGVSVFALQLARLFGAEVIITSSSDAKLECAREFGAAHTINYREDPQWSRTVRALTNGEGVDHIVEVGGVGTLTQSTRCVAMGGNIYLIGVLAGPEAPLNLTPVLMQDVRIQGVFVGPVEAFEEMNRAIAASGLRPVIDTVFPLDEVQEAFSYMESGEHFGKIVISMD
ncbi:MAG: NAD(P)-dependent alcohol dehydrogenase [Candidatus Hydrogenedentes bacterium]|nr:NAD(P)-dependent alcohol dehydrogenase [Candidatus Hydrogenedentota bacterium]